MSYTTIIPTRNRPGLLERALRSVYAQTRAAAQIVIVDDGSDPITAIPPDLQDPRVLILRNDTPLGGQAARNIGLSASANEFVAFLDDDDEWLPRKMELQLSYLKSHPECPSVSCGYWRIQSGVFYQEVVTEQFLARYGHYDSYIGSFSFMVIRRDSSGGFPQLDLSLPAFQDWDYYLRLEKQGRIGMLAVPLGLYHAHAENRVTTRGDNRIIGLRRCYFRHRRVFSSDERRWILARMAFNRASRSADFRRRFKWVAISVRMAHGCQLPPATKWRALTKRILNIAVNVAQLERLRAVTFGVMARLARAKHEPCDRPVGSDI